MTDQPGPHHDPQGDRMTETGAAREGDYYADSIHVTESGAIGMNVGGFIIVKPIREWHKLAQRAIDGVGSPQAPPEVIIEIDEDGRVHKPTVLAEPEMEGPDLQPVTVQCPHCERPFVWVPAELFTRDYLALVRHGYVLSGVGSDELRAALEQISAQAKPNDWEPYDQFGDPEGVDISNGGDWRDFGRELGLLTAAKIARAALGPTP